MDECKKRILFLNDVFTQNYPASDETVYLRALSMENADTSVKIRECIQVFEKISDYKDSKDRIKKLEAKFEEVLQYEKEQAILQRESKEAARQESAKKAGKIILIVIVAGIAAAVAFVVMCSKKQKESDYQTAVTYMEEQSYEGAVQLFSKLKDYNDASELLDQCCNLWIEQANTYIEEANYEQALLCLEAIEDLPDALDVREDTKQKLSEAAEMIDDVEKMQNLQLAIEYYDVEYLMAWADRGEFKQLTGDEIREIIVGQWNAVHDSNRNKVVRYDYEADGTLLSLDGVSDGTVITYSYTVENDYLVSAGTERVVYDLGNGYYLIYRADSYVSGALYWRR
jgi:tetratricopeptide (TPR) repeat protein